MLKWVIAIAVIISGSILGFMYYQLGQYSTEVEVTTPLPSISTIRIVDGYKDGIHRLSGVVKLPHSCYSVAATTVVDHEVDPIGVSIVLRSKDNILDQPVCAQIRTRYPFEVLVEAQKDVAIKLVLDGEELPTAVTQTDWQSPAGNVVNIDPL